ncbi:MAG: HD domain-containing protein [Patescibacteria group bacterium]
MKNIVSIILEAQKQLVLKPIDLAHDITHHYRVYEWSLKINNSEKLNANADLLTVCAWYHDLGGRTGKNAKLIRDLIGKHTDDKGFADKVVRIVQEHSFGKTQSSLESQILFDADKLEYVNPFRLLWFRKAYKEHLINEEKYKQYKKEWEERIGKVKNMLHFNYSQEKFLKFLPQAERIMRK